jgi:ABC-2 type transport system permease protein
MPFVLASVLGSVYSHGSLSRLPILLIDQDQSPLSAQLKDMLEDNPKLHIVKVFNESIDLHQSLLDERATAVVVIPFRFGAQVLAARHPEVNCFLNMGNTLTAGAAGSAIAQCVGAMNAGISIRMQESMGTPAVLAHIRTEAFGTRLFQQFNPTGNYLLFLWPGLFFSMLHQLLLMGTAVSFSREVAGGTFNDEGVLGHSHSPLVLIFSKVIPYVTVSLITLAVYFLLGNLFRVRNPGQPWILILSQLLLILSTSLLGVLYSILYPVPLKASQLLMSLASPAFTISGFTWPFDHLPMLIRVLSDVIPLTPFLRILRMTVLQDASFGEVLPSLQHQAILAFAFLVLAALLLSRRIKAVALT